MSDSVDAIGLLDLVIGVLVVATFLCRTWLGRIGVPSLVGFLVLGFLLRLGDARWNLISEQGESVFEFLASIGVIALLFRVGLEARLHGLISKLPRATPIWIGNVVLSGVPAFLLSHYLLGVALTPSLFVAVALTATSVAVSVEVWREAGALNSANGETLIDVAELDDLSAVALMALLISMAPALQLGDGDSAVEGMASAAGLFALKVAAFCVVCIVFARFAETRLAGILKATSPPDSILIVAGIGIIIAALAELLGLSFAIGALFAGLIFSRDPDAVKLETSFLPLHAFFSPFFFIAIGLNIDPGALGSGLQLGGALLFVAVLGKVIGAGGPALLTTGWAGATLIGVSMVPRAEIAMIVVEQGRRLGDWAVTPELYASVAIISLATCIVPPAVIRWLLRRWPQPPE